MSLVHKLINKVSIITVVIFVVTQSNATFAQSKLVPYSGQGAIKCNGTDIQVPAFRSVSYDNLFLKYDGSKCDVDNVEVSIGIGPDCGGQQNCFTNFYSKHKVNGYMSSAIDAGFSQKYNGVELNKNLVGYFIPVQVNAYPTPSRLLWINQDHVYLIGQKGGKEDDLIKSANSLIDSIP